jgi:rRNA maturation endonuclease Nob1
MQSESDSAASTVRIVSNPALSRVGPAIVRYGLPCANCSAYYGADLAACPICGCGDRVAPISNQLRTAPML